MCSEFRARVSKVIQVCSEFRATVSKVIQVCPEEVQGNIALKYKFSARKFCVCWPKPARTKQMKTMGTSTKTDWNRK